MAKVLREAQDWMAFADVAPELDYADWRDEVLSMVGAPEPAAPVCCICQRLLTSAA